MQMNTSWGIAQLRKMSVAALSLLAISSASFVSAADITWSLTDFNAGTLDLSGTIVSAVNVGGPQTDVTIGADTVTFTDGSATPGIFGANGNSGGGTPTFTNTAGNAELETVLDSHRWATGGEGTVATVTLSNLTAGQDYELQAFMTDIRGCCATRDYFYSDGNGNDSAVWTRESGTIAVGTFTADAITQDFSVVANTGTGSSDPGLGGYVLKLVGGGGFFEAELNRDTGVLSMTNNSIAAVDFLGYSILSAGGSLSQTSWDTISGRLDAPSNGGDGSVDSDDAWLVLSDAASHTDLSEGELNVGGGNGGAIGIGQTVSFGNVWIKNPAEDIQLELLRSDGTIQVLPVTFTGNGGSPFAQGDLNFDGSITTADWAAYVASGLSDLSGFSPAEAYQLGDLNGDGMKNILDTDQFIDLYDAANGVGAFAADITAVPEPSTIAMVAMGFVALVSRRNGPKKLPSGLVMAMLMLVVVACNGTARAADISWSLTDFNTGNLDLATGTIIEAVNVGGPQTDVTIGADTVTFDAGNDGSTEVDNSDVLTAFGAGDSGGGAPTFTNTGGNADLETVLDSHRWATGGGGTATTVTLQNLVVGQSYELQTFMTDIRGCCGGRDYVYSDGNGNDSAAWTRDSGTIGVGSFVADASTQTFDVVAGAASSDPGLSGYVLKAVSELVLLTLEVNTVTGAVSITNNSSESLSLNSYEITSPAGSLNAAGWNSLSDQNIDPIGAGVGETWDEVADGTASLLHEGFLLGSSTVDPSETLGLGGAYDVGMDSQDISFRYRDPANGSLVNGVVSYVDTPGSAGDFDMDGDVDGADFLLWQRGGSPNPLSASDLAEWQSNYGPGSLSAATAAVPEPSSLMLLVLAGLAVGCRRSSHSSATKAVAFNKARWASLMLFLGGMLFSATAVQAEVYDERFYELGEGSLVSGANTVVENGVAGQPVGNAVTVNGSGGITRQSLDSGDPSPGAPNPAGTFTSLDTFIGNPVYAATNDRPGAAANELGASFDGDDSISTPLSLNAPAQFWDNDNFHGTGNTFPLNYEGLFTHSLQFWAKPNSATQNAQQDLVWDTSEHGVSITDTNNWGLQYDKVLVDSGVPVAFDQWTHVMEVTGGVLYVNGIAVAVQLTAYDPSEEALVMGSNLAGDGNFYNGIIDEVRVSLWGDNTGEDNGGAGPNGQDYGEFDLFEDNDWIANEIATTLPGGTLMDGDINRDGSVDAADITAFVDGWRSAKLLGGAAVGDWETWGWGDLNSSGVVDWADGFIFHEALLAAGVAGGLDFSLLTAVPEPSTAVLLTALSLVYVGRFRKIG